MAIVGEEEKVKAVGKEAKNLLGKTAENTSIIYPVYEGEIYDMGLAVALLKEFLSRVGVKASALRRAQVLFSVPCGIGEEALSAYQELVEECGLKKVFFVEQPYLAAAGAGAVTKLVDYNSDNNGKIDIDRVFSVKYPYEYLSEDQSEKINRAIIEHYEKLL